MPDTGSPLVQIATASARSVLQLKCWQPEKTVLGKAFVVVGHSLPRHVGATAGADRRRVLCLGPNEWLIFSPWSEAGATRERVDADIPNQGLVLCDQTDGLVAFEVHGPAARNFLAKGCSLDFHPRVFPVNHCARTRFAQIPVVIDSFDGPPRFELYVGRSHERYLRSWLEDAAVEFLHAPRENL